MLSETGKELDLGRWVVGREFVEDYLEAVEDSLSIYGQAGIVPPMALAARALGALLKELSLPPGTIHAGQELDCRREVILGESVSCNAKVSRPVRRGDWQFLSAEFTLYGSAHEALITGKSTVLIPLEGEQSGHTRTK